MGFELATSKREADILPTTPQFDMLVHICFGYDGLCENFKPLYLGPQGSRALLVKILFSNPHMIYILEKSRFVSPISPKIVPLLATFSNCNITLIFAP